MRSKSNKRSLKNMISFRCRYLHDDSQCVRVDTFFTFNKKYFDCFESRLFSLIIGIGGRAKHFGHFGKTYGIVTVCIFKIVLFC